MIEPSVDAGFLNPNLHEQQPPRPDIMVLYGVDFFLATWAEAGSGLTFLDFFQRNRENVPKGIVQLALEEMA